MGKKGKMMGFVGKRGDLTCDILSLPFLSSLDDFAADYQWVSFRRASLCLWDPSDELCICWGGREKHKRTYERVTFFFGLSRSSPKVENFL